jgi:DNA repair exonuclease SbcCD ATPase subunit
MKKLIVTLATAALLIAPVSLVSASPKGGPERAKCSVSDVKNHKVLDEAAKAAKKAAEEAKHAAGKLKEKKSKVESELKKAKEGKTKKVKTVEELKAKQVKLDLKKAELTSQLTTLGGKRLAGAKEQLKEIERDLAKLVEAITKAEADAAAAAAAVETVTIEVKEVVVDVNDAAAEAEEAAREAAKKAAELAKEQGKCKR